MRVFDGVKGVFVVSLEVSVHCKARRVVASGICQRVVAEGPRFRPDICQVVGVLMAWLGRRSKGHGRWS